MSRKPEHEAADTLNREQAPEQDWSAATFAGARLAMLRENLERTPQERIELMCDLSEVAEELARASRAEAMDA